MKRLSGDQSKARPAQIDVAQRTCFAGVERTNPEDELEPLSVCGVCDLTTVWRDACHSNNRSRRRHNLKADRLACQPRLTKV